MKCAVALVFVLFLASSQGFDWGSKLTKKIDCGVSPWSDWKCADNKCNRSRKILRESANGGQPCPALTETKAQNSQADPWDRKNVEVKIQNKFITGHQRAVSFADTPGQGGGKTILTRDLMLIVDMSGSISKQEFQKTKRKMGEMIELICGTIGKTRQHNRISVITFSDIVTLNFDFKKYYDLKAVKKAIMRIPQRRSSTCTGDALHFAHTTMFDPKSGVRDATESIKEVLVLTDGRSNCGKDLAVEVKKLQVKAFVYALAIGSFSPKGKAEIESMVSRPLIDHIFSLDTFQRFFQMVDALKTFPYPNRCVPFELSR